MNWYKRAQLNKEAGWGKSFMGLTIPMIILLIGGTAYDIAHAIKERPQELAQKIQQVQQQTVDPNGLGDPNTIAEPNEPNSIDLDKIWFMESTRGTHPDMEKSTAGARGHFQFMKKTWDDLVQRMGKDWDWFNGSMDYDKSSAVAQYYLNDRIPYMLNAYKIPDTIENRLGAFDWGIGHLRKAWKKYGENWLELDPSVPQETKDYMTRYE